MWHHTWHGIHLLEQLRWSEKGWRKDGAKVPTIFPDGNWSFPAIWPLNGILLKRFGKTQLFEVPSCQIIDHNFYGFPNFSDSAIGDFLKLWRGMERDHARISNFSGRGRMLEFELLEHFASWKRLAIFGNSRRVLKVKGLISRLETHKIESERANSMFVNTVWVTSN